MGGASLRPVSCCLWSHGDKHGASQRTSPGVQGLGLFKDHFPSLSKFSGTGVTISVVPPPGELFCAAAADFTAIRGSIAAGSIGPPGQPGAFGERRGRNIGPLVASRPLLLFIASL